MTPFGERVRQLRRERGRMSAIHPGPARTRDIRAALAERIVVLDGAAGTYLLEPLAVRAQQTGKVFRIGLLFPATEPAP